MHLDQVKVDYPHIPLSASTKEIEIRIQILPLLFGRANISRVHISQPFLEFSLINPAAKSGKGQESEDEGKQKQQITPEELFEQVAKGLRMALDGRKSLDELPLEIGLVEIRDLGVVLKVKEDTRVAIKNADISLQGLTEQITRVRLTMPRLEIFAGKLTKKISSNIAVKMSENSMVLEEFMIKSDDEKLSLKVLLHRLEKKSASKAEDITLEGKVEVELPLNNINKYSPSIPKMEGRLKTDVEFNGALPNINAKLGLDVNGLSIDEYRVGDIKGDISLNSEKLIINSLEVLAAGGKVNVDGHIDLNRGYNGVLKVKLEKFGLLNLLRNLTVTHNYVDLKVSGLIECNTILPEVLFKGSSQLVVEELEVYPRPIELAGDKNKIVAIKKSEFKFDFDLDPEGINIKNGKIDLMSGQGNIDVKGDVFFTVEKGLNLEAKTQNLMLDNFPILDYQFKGKASAQTLLKGPYLLLNIIGELSVKDFSFQNVDLTSLDLAYTWKGEEEGSMFSFRELKSFSAGGTRLLASGDIDLRQEPLLDIKFLADKLNMEDVIVALPDTVSGKGELRQYIKGSGRAQGSLKIGKDITDIKISADLNALTLATQNYSGGKLAISYKQPILHIHKLSLYEDKKGDANILAKGRVNTSSGNIDLDLGTRN